MQQRHWRVSLTVGGDAVPVDRLRIALQRLSREHPFLLPGRYAADRVEITYWEEAADAAAATALALRLWDDHRTSAELPAWQVLALEVVDRDIYQSRPDAVLTGPSGPVAEWYPF